MKNKLRQIKNRTTYRYDMTNDYHLDLSEQNLGPTSEALFEAWTVDDQLITNTRCESSGIRKVYQIQLFSSSQWPIQLRLSRSTGLAADAASSKSVKGVSSPFHKNLDAQ